MFIQMELNILEIGNKIYKKDKVKKYFKINQNIQVNFLKGKKKDKEYIIGLMVQLMKDHFNLIYFMDMGKYMINYKFS